MGKNRIEKNDIISDEAIENVKMLSSELHKLDRKLESFSEKYNVPYDQVLLTIRQKMKKRIQLRDKF